MLNGFIELLLILLLIFTPVAFGAMDLWAASLMELGILLIIVLWILRSSIGSSLIKSKPQAPIPNPKSWAPNSLPVRQAGELRAERSDSAFHNPHSAFETPYSLLLFLPLSLFLLLILFQMSPLPSGLIRLLSPRTYELRHSLLIPSPPFELSALRSTLSFVPIATKVEFFKWVTLTGLFLFLLSWIPLSRESRTRNYLIVVVFLIGVFESLYGMFEFFSGHDQVLHLKGLVSSVMGTFINRNYFAGYLLMVIPLSIGFLLSREDIRYKGWRHRLSSLDGKTLLIGFGIIVMALGLLFSASRMGIISLLLSFTLISFLFGSLHGEKRFSNVPILILVLTLVWAFWIGLDAVISRFFTSSEDFKSRWEIWVDTFRIIRDLPLWGSGLGTFTQVFPFYRSSHELGFRTHAENDLLQLASEVGLVGTGLLLILFFFLLYKAVSGLRSLSQRDPQRYIGLGGLVGILALMFHSLVERNIQVPANAFLYTFIWALVLRASTRKRKRVEAPGLNAEDN